MKYNFKKSWYVLRVRSKTEKLVHLGLHKKNFEILNPTFTSLSIRKDRRKFLEKPIFKGYMFIRTLLDPNLHLQILKTPGVIEILKSSNGPIPISDEQIENVRILQNHIGNFFHRSNFEIGDSVFVREGPLTG